MKFLTGVSLVLAWLAVARAEIVVVPEGLRHVRDISQTVTFHSDPPPVVGGSIAAFTDTGNQLVIVDLKDGTEKRRVPIPIGGPTDYFRSGKLHVFGTEVYFAEYSFISNSLRLHVFDSVSGTLRSSQNSVFTSPESHDPNIVLDVRADEIRLSVPEGSHSSSGPVPSVVLRWRRSDLLPLASLNFGTAKNSNGPRMDSVIGVWFGESFCAGLKSGHKDALVLERNGKSSLMSLGMSASFSTRSSISRLEYAVSDNHLAIRVSNQSHSPNGFLVWKTSDSNPQPTFIGTQGGSALQKAFIVGERFLTVFRSSDYQNADSLHVHDIANPGLPPVVVKLPAGIIVPETVTAHGSDLCLIIKSPAPKDKRVLLHLPGMVGSMPIGVAVKPASGTEAGGWLRFRVESNRPPAAPIRVSLKARTGSAVEGQDFAPFNGSLLLTPARSFADVSIAILPDSEKEATETMTLEVVDGGGAWVSNKYAHGQIHQGGFSFSSRIGRPPGAGAGFRFRDWAMTEHGVVAGVGGPAGYSYHLFKHGGSSWKPLSCLAGLPFDSLFSPRIVANAGNRVLVTRRNTLQGPSLHSLVDVLDDVVINDIAGPDPAILTRDMAAVGSSDSGSQYVSRNATSGGVIWQRNPWETEYGYPGRPCRVDDATFIHSLDDSLLRRKHSDGSLVEEITSPLFARFETIHGGGGYWMAMEGNNRLWGVIGNTRPGALFPATFHNVPEYGSDWAKGFVTEDGFGIFPSSAGGGKVTAIDCATGMLLDTFDDGDPQPLGTAGRWFALERDEALTVYDTRPDLPGPATTVMTRREDETGDWIVGLSSAAPSAMTISARSAGPDIQSLPPVTVPAGSLAFRVPARVALDNSPEADETATFWLDFSGGGKTASFRMKVVIPANQNMLLPVPGKGKLLRKASSVDLHPSGLVIGSLAGNAAADPRYKRVIRGGGNSGFGESIACNRDYLAVGAVDLTGESRSKASVALFRRKSGARVATLESDSSVSLFGAVLHMDEKRLFVGAPPYGDKGTVLMMELASGRKIVLRDPEESRRSQFGYAIASAGNQAWIGSPGAKTRGRAYQFDVRSGRKVREIVPPTGGIRNFGISLAVVGTTLFVGAPGGDDADSAVYAYNANTGRPLFTISSPFADGGNFGASLGTLSGGRLLVGCPGASFAPSGGVLVYQLSSSRYQLVTLLQPDTKKDTGGGSLKGMGMAGGLAGANGLMGVVVKARRDPLDILGTTYRYGRDTAVALYDLDRFLPKTRPLRAPVRASGDPTPADPWSRALGEGATEADGLIRISSTGSRRVLVLPTVSVLNPGSRLTLECSDDMLTWRQAALLDGDDDWKWMAATEGIGELSEGRVVLPQYPMRLFFRIKCEAP
jgi:hypothetical protein